MQCQNWEISAMDRGQFAGASQLADYMLELQEHWRTHSINFVSLTHNGLVIMKAIEIAAHLRLKVPIVWNRSGRDTVAQLRLLDGIIDIYMPDAKYASRAVARKLIGDYLELHQPQLTRFVVK
jgi:putative pyruvate formate lyase activating enzyme